MTSHGGETVSLASFESDTLPEAYDVQRGYNIWHGLYQAGRQSYLHLEGLEVVPGSQNSLLTIALPKQAAGIILDHTNRTTTTPAEINVTYAVAAYATEDGFSRRLHSIGLTEDGSPATLRVLEELLDRRQRRICAIPLESRPVQSADLTTLSSTFDKLEVRRKQAHERRMQPPMKPVGQLGLRGLFTALQGKKK